MLLLLRQSMKKQNKSLLSSVIPTNMRMYSNTPFWLLHDHRIPRAASTSDHTNCFLPKENGDPKRCITIQVSNPHILCIYIYI